MNADPVSAGPLADRGGPVPAFRRRGAVGFGPCSVHVLSTGGNFSVPYD